MTSSNQTNIVIMEMFRDCLPLFSVLNDEKRQEIILIVAESEEEGITVNAITEQVSLSRPAVSHHLKVLKQAGIVNVRNKGVENYYILTLKDSVNRLKQLTAVIEDGCILL